MKITEENFASRLKAKDEKALEYVIDNYGWVIKTVVRKHLSTLVDYQEECINDIILAIWQNIDRFDENKSTFKNWVAAISKYKAIDYSRKYLKHLENQNIDDLEIRDKNDLHEEVIKEELSEELEEMLSHLKPKDRELFIKLYVKEQEIDEVALDMGVSRDNLYNRVSRGKKKLKDVFKRKVG
ncbi:MAG: sigma-70 family RNA polymerase sigma factor [Paraclostridium sp.]